jgi:hypothetical protein
LSTGERAAALIASATSADLRRARAIEEIPKQPYAEIARMLLAAGATVPDRVGANGPRATMLIAELGINPSG